MYNFLAQILLDLSLKTFFNKLLLHAIFDFWGVFLVSSNLHEVGGQKKIMPMLNLKEFWTKSVK